MRRSTPVRAVLVKTIQQNFGIPINHVVVANFPGFEAMVNALGGISLDFSDPRSRPVLRPERDHDRAARP